MTTEQHVSESRLRSPESLVEKFNEHLSKTKHPTRLQRRSKRDIVKMCQKDAKLDTKTWPTETMMQAYLEAFDDFFFFGALQDFTKLVLVEHAEIVDGLTSLGKPLRM
ncbi:hypothetical protein MMC15_008039 [Xylographa vitiligo]|nr:hypothetical protein [Xylographa vitiligo]